jgi:ribosome-binding protein aMBF1 (putative translation factor)
MVDDGLRCRHGFGGRQRRQRGGGSMPFHSENLNTAPMPSTKTGFDRELEHPMTDLEWAAGNRRARARSEQTEMVRRAIESQRVRLRITKTELARRIGAEPSVIRRLLTSNSNPTIGGWIADMLDELGLELTVRRKPRQTDRAENPAASLSHGKARSHGLSARRQRAARTRRDAASIRSRHITPIASDSSGAMSPRRLTKKLPAS